MKPRLEALLIEASQGKTHAKVLDDTYVWFSERSIQKPCRWKSSPKGRRDPIVLLELDEKPLNMEAFCDTLKGSLRENEMVQN